MDIDVQLKGGLKTEHWKGVLAILRNETEHVLLHADGGESIYPVAQVRKIMRAS